MTKLQRSGGKLIKSHKKFNMKRLISVGILAILIIGLSSCRKDNIEHVFYFYTSIDTAKIELKLYIDGNYKGILKNPSITPDCSSPDSILSSLIIDQFPYGKYKIEARDESGEIRSSGTMKFKKNSMSSSGNGDNGGLSILGTDNCIIVDIFE
jgi:hypothetical protein